jgi:hypothetical protein
MKLSTAVRIGGRLALVGGFVLTNLVFGNSLNYYYGYSSASFGIAQSSDVLNSQNVNFTPQVSMISSQNQNASDGSASTQNAGSSTAVTNGGFTVLSSVYGYAAPAVTQAPTYVTAAATTFVNTGGTWNPVAVATAVTPTSQLATTWNPLANTVQTPTSSYTSSYSPSTTQTYAAGTAYIGGWYSVPTPPAPASGDIYGIVYGDYVPPPTVGYGAVTSTVVPNVSNAISTPSVPGIVGPSAPQSSISLGPSIDAPLGAPEPGTILMMSAGLALVFLKLRRR